MDCPKIKVTCLVKAKRRRDKGQTLVVVLVLLVIAAVVSTAVAYRAIQDIRTSTEERNSAVASAQIDSLIEVTMDPDVWETIWVSEAEDAYCEDYSGGQICELFNGFWLDYLETDSLECDSWNVKTRREDQVNSFFIGKDEVVEFDIRNEDGSARLGTQELNFSWDGGAEYLLLRFYKDGDIIEDIAIGNGDPRNWNAIAEHYFDVSSTGGVYTVTIEDTGSADVVRIKALYGDATFNLSGLATGYYQVGAVKAYCYIGDVFREAVSQVLTRDYVPGVFDYALFDATGLVDKGPGL